MPASRALFPYNVAGALRLRALCARAVWRHVSNMLGKAVHSWVIYTTDTVATRQLALKETREWWRLRRSAVFTAWRDEAVERFYNQRRGGGRGGGAVTVEGLARAFAQRRRRASLVLSLALLRRNFLNGESRRATFIRVAAQMATRQLARAFAGWLLTARLDGLRNKSRIDQEDAAAAAATARTAACTTAAARVVTRRERRVLVGAFAGWADLVARERQLRRAVARSSARVCRRVLTAALSRLDRWAKDSVRRRANASRVIARYSLRAEAAALRGWRHATSEDAHRRRRILQRVAARFMHRRRAAGFARWTYSTSEARRLRSVAVRALYKITTRATARAFESWSWFRAESKRRRGIINRVILKRRSLGLSHALAGWIAGIAAHKRGVQLTTRVLLRMCARVSSEAFRAWCEFRGTATRARRLDEVSAVFLRRRRGRECLRHWRRSTAAAKRRRHVVGIVSARMTRRTMAGSFARCGPGPAPRYPLTKL
jgi:hypothetical protein